MNWIWWFLLKFSSRVSAGAQRGSFTCVTTMLQSDALPALMKRSRMYWGTWVVLPQPVAPLMITTGLLSIVAMISSSNCLTGSWSRSDRIWTTQVLNKVCLQNKEQEETVTKTRLTFCRFSSWSSWYISSSCRSPLICSGVHCRRENTIRIMMIILIQVPVTQYNMVTSQQSSQ